MEQVTMFDAEGKEFEMKRVTIENLERQLALGPNCEFVIGVALSCSNHEEFHSHCWRRVSGPEHGKAVYDRIHAAKDAEYA